MLLVTSAEMAAIERDAITRYKIPRATLMEAAGRSVADWIVRQYREYLSPKSTIYVFCGPGNNGGDGLICARYLAEGGYSVEVVLLTSAPLDLPRPKKGDLIVDALFGTGFNRPPEGPAMALIRLMNRSKTPVVSVDIASGLSADTGRPLRLAVRADSTVTFQLMKQGQALYPGCELSGKLHIADIGIPPLLIKQHQLKRHMVMREDVARWLKPRAKDSHKGSYGHAVVVGGELGKIGAGLLAAKAFMRAGGGLASFALPETSYERIDPRFLELMYIPLHTDAPTLTSAIVAPLAKHLDRKAVCILGPGLGSTVQAQAFVTDFLTKVHVPIVLDADGLNCIARDLDLLAHHRGRLILTPHPGEMSRLTGRKIAAIQEDRVAAARDFAVTYDVYLVLKGYRSVIATPQGEIFINTSGNPGMATAGMGDVLSGVIAAFVAQGYSMKHALLLGVHIHGLAGDRVCAEKGERGILAQDVIEALPNVMRDLSPPDQESKNQKES